MSGFNVSVLMGAGDGDGGRDWSGAAGEESFPTLTMPSFLRLKRETEDSSQKYFHGSI